MVAYAKDLSRIRLLNYILFKESYIRGSAFFLIFILVSTALVQGQCFDFERSDGEGWDKEYLGPLAPQWQRDNNFGHESNKSMKSGEFRLGTTTSLLSSGIRREVMGPVDISFWWMSDTMPDDCGKLLFLVDNRPIATIYNSDSWKQQTHSIGENGSHLMVVNQQ